MYIDSIMTTHVISITEDTHMNEINELIEKHTLLHLPVVNQSNELLGLVSSRDIQKALPSEITTLTVGESNYLLSKITASQIMSGDLVYCKPETLIEEAAQILRDQSISSLPVLKDGKLVGIVTIEDILDFFLDVTGCRQKDATRIAVRLEDSTGNLSLFLNKINEMGGYIISVASPTKSDEEGKRICIVRFYADHPRQVDEHLRKSGIDFVSENFLSEENKS